MALAWRAERVHQPVHINTTTFLESKDARWREVYGSQPWRPRQSVWLRCLWQYETAGFGLNITNVSGSSERTQLIVTWKALSNVSNVSNAFVALPISLESPSLKG